MPTDNPVTQGEPGKTGRLVCSIAETAAVAAELLPAMLRAGVVSLEGPLGAGKTHFVKAVAVSLGIRDEVTSPTFTLLHRYGFGEKLLHHFDWYRLESSAEVLALGLDEYYGEGLMIIEWGDKFPEILPPDTLRIRIEPLESIGSEAAESRRISWRQNSQHQ
jgi:tRNA threonylcarbamoyladenosine biosynthesis protein TsaE